MSAGVFEFNGVLLLIDIAENRALFDIYLGFFEVGLGLDEIGTAFFPGVCLLSALHFHLMGEIVRLGGCVAGELELIGGIELGEQFVGFDGCAVFYKLQQSELAAHAVLSRNLNQERMKSAGAAGTTNEFMRGRRSPK